MNITKLQSQIDHMARQLFDETGIKVDRVRIDIVHTELSDSNERVESIGGELTIIPSLDDNSGGGGGGGGGS